jgi:signal transduction histidine kinase
VDDDGPGIADDVVERIFDPFFSTKPKRRGTGVGLSMVRRMAMLYGGSVIAQPHGELGGASFCIELPVETGGTTCTA